MGEEVKKSCLYICPVAEVIHLSACPRCIHFLGTLLTKFTHESLRPSRHMAAATSPPRSTFTPTFEPVAMVKRRQERLVRPSRTCRTWTNFTPITAATL